MRVARSSARLYIHSIAAVTQSRVVKIRQNSVVQLCVDALLGFFDDRDEFSFHALGGVHFLAKVEAFGEGRGSYFTEEGEGVDGDGGFDFFDSRVEVSGLIWLAEQGESNEDG